MTGNRNTILRRESHINRITDKQVKSRSPHKFKNQDLNFEEVNVDNYIKQHQKEQNATN